MFCMFAYASTLRFVLMEITKVVKPFIRRGANTFGNIAYVFYPQMKRTYTILPKWLAPLLMKGWTTLVISMSTNLNVSAYNDILGNLIV